MIPFSGPDNCKRCIIIFKNNLKINKKQKKKTKSYRISLVINYMAFAYTHTKLISLQRSHIVIINYRGVGVTRSLI